MMSPTLPVAREKETTRRPSGVHARGNTNVESFLVRRREGLRVQRAAIARNRVEKPGRSNGSIPSKKHLLLIHRPHRPPRRHWRSAHEWQGRPPFEDENRHAAVRRNDDALTVWRYLQAPIRSDFVTEGRANCVEDSAQISPDGHWLAYRSNRSGRFEVAPAPSRRTRRTTRLVKRQRPRPPTRPHRCAS